jgi:amino acid permease
VKILFFKKQYSTLHRFLKAKAFHKKMKKYISIIAIIINCVSTVSAQSLDNLFRSEGKIYVVVGTLAIILSGIILFLIRIDKNLTKLENQIKRNEH